jgi:hypothetical protein
MKTFYAKAFCSFVVGAGAPALAVSATGPQDQWGWVVLGIACLVGGASSLKAYLSKAAGWEDPQ